MLTKKEHAQKYREKNREKLKLYARQFRKEGRATRNKKIQHETIKKWIKKYPEKRRAHGKVAYALKTGKLIKLPCLVCNKLNVHAHHEDYFKPLDVIWLCPIHHHEWDKQRRQKENNT